MPVRLSSSVWSPDTGSSAHHGWSLLSHGSPQFYWLYPQSVSLRLLPVPCGPACGIFHGWPVRTVPDGKVKYSVRHTVNLRSGRLPVLQCYMLLKSSSDGRSSSHWWRFRSGAYPLSWPDSSCAYAVQNNPHHENEWFPAHAPPQYPAAAKISLWYPCWPHLPCNPSVHCLRSGFYLNFPVLLPHYYTLTNLRSVHPLSWTCAPVPVCNDM